MATRPWRISRTLALVLLGVTAAVVPLAFDVAGFFQTELPKRLLAALAIWTLALLTLPGGDGGADRALRLPWTVLLFGAFLLWELAVWPFALTPVQGLDTVLADLESFGWCVVAVHLATRASWRWVFLGGFAAAGIVAATIGLIQDASADPAAFPLGADAAMALSGLVDPVWRALDLDRVLQTDAPGSLFGHTNVAAELVAASSFPLVLGLWALARRGGAARIVAILIAPSVAAPLLFLARSGSRGAIGAAAVVLVALLVLGAIGGARRRPLFGSPILHLATFLFAGLAALAIVAAFARAVEVEPRHGQAPRSLAARAASAFDPAETTVRERLDLYANTWSMSRSNPVFGVGPGNFRIAYPEFARAARRHEPGRLTVRRQPHKPHHEYLHKLAETGFFGGILFLLAALSGPLAGLRLLCRDVAARRPLRLDLAAALAATGTILVIALIAFPFQQTATRLLFWGAAGALASAGWESSGRRRRWTPSGPARVVLAGALIAMLAVTVLHARARHEASRALGAARDLEVPAAPRAAARAVHLERLRAVEAAAVRTPTDDGAGLFRAEALRRIGRLAAADRVIDDVLAVHPNLVNAWIARSGLALDRGRVAAAEDAAQRAIALDPGAPTAQLAMARAEATRGRHGEAFERLKTALELEPIAGERLGILLELALVAHRARQPVITAMMLSRAEELDSRDPRLLETRAIVLESQSPGSEPAALAWRRLLEAVPGHPEAHFRLGLRELAEGRPQEALAELDRAFEAAPERPVLLFHRARALAALDRLEEAVASVYACMKRSGRDGGDPYLWNRCYQLGLELQERLASQAGETLDGERG